MRRRRRKRRTRMMRRRITHKINNQRKNTQNRNAMAIGDCRSAGCRVAHVAWTLTEHDQRPASQRNGWRTNDPKLNSGDLCTQTCKTQTKDGDGGLGGLGWVCSVGSVGRVGRVGRLGPSGMIGEGGMEVGWAGYMAGRGGLGGEKAELLLRVLDFTVPQTQHDDAAHISEKKTRRGIHSWRRMRWQAGFFSPLWIVGPV